MIHTDQRFHDAIEHAVTRLETRTDAEVVVVAASRSGLYRDVNYVAATVCSLVVLLIAFFSPFSVTPPMVVLDLVFTWLFSAWLLSDDRILRFFVSRARKRAQAREAAAAEFHREAVYATPRRTGLLIYVSAFEESVELLPDHGLQGRIPAGEWQPVADAIQARSLDGFLDGLETLGNLLARRVPRTSDDDFDLPNAPRVRP